MQEAAERAVRDGLMRFAGGKGWRDPGLSIDVSDDWRGQLAAARFGAGYDDWRAAVVLSKEGDSATLGFIDGSQGTLPASAASMPKRGTGTPAFNSLQPGLIIAVKRSEERREGKAWVSTCRSRWSPATYKKKKKHK